MATVAESLFGVTPESLMAQREQQLQQRALQYAELDPMQAARAGFYTAGSRLGSAVGGLLGAEDPELMRVRQRQELLQGVNPTDPASLRAAAQKAMERKDYQAAQMFADRALSAEKTQSEISKNLRERAAADPFQKLVEQGKYLPESLAKYEQTGNVQDLVLARPEAQRKTSTVTAGGRKLLIDDLTGETIRDLGPAGKTLEESLGAGLGMIGKALAAGQKKEAEETGQFAAKDFNTLGSAVAAGTASKRNITVLENAMQNAFTGKFADVKEGVITGLEGLGIKVGGDLREAASNTQLVNAMGTRYVFPLVKNFPGSLAAKELERLEKTAPNALQQPETIQTLMNLLKQDLAENEYTYNKAKQYRDQNKGSTIGFNQADAKIEFQNKLTDLRTRVQAAKRAGRMTAAERDQINALKKELGVE